MLTHTWHADSPHSPPENDSVPLRHSPASALCQPTESRAPAELRRTERNRVERNSPQECCLFEHLCRQVPHRFSQESVTPAFHVTHPYMEIICLMHAHPTHVVNPFSLTHSLSLSPSFTVSLSLHLSLSLSLSHSLSFLELFRGEIPDSFAPSLHILALLLEAQWAEYVQHLQFNLFIIVRSLHRNYQALFSSPASTPTAGEYSAVDTT